MAKHAYRQLVLGMIALFIVMAIGRFAYTPIFPFMKHAGTMNDQNAGFLATLNYLGYLIGAIIPLGFIFKSKVIDLKIYLIINILTTIFMGFTEQYIIWAVYRIISGITSGAVFVLASNIVLEALKQGRRESISGLLYSAVGIGIFSSSIFIYFFTTDVRWQATWIILGICSLIGGLLVVIGMTENQTVKQDNNVYEHTQQQGQRFPKFMRFFSIAYFCEGAGYIITGTFLVAIVKSIPALADYSALSWMFVGLGAIPSTVIWSMVAEKIGYDKAIYGGFILQIIGISMPVFSHNSISLIISSLLFGATFLGLTTLFMSKGQQLMYKANGNANYVATLTVIYSVGQMIAPSISGWLIGDSGNYNAALIFATMILIVGLISAIVSFKVTEQKDDVKES